MAREHAPSRARAIVNAAWKGRPVRELAAEAREIRDPYHAAWALFHLSRDDATLRPQAMDLLDRVPEAWRKAELAADIAKRVKDDPDTLEGLARRVVSLPPSKARSEALQGLAKTVPSRLLVEILAQVVKDEPTAVEDGKNVLRQWAKNPTGEVTEAFAAASADTRAQLYAYLHLQGAKSGQVPVPDAFDRAVQAAKEMEDRVEILRYLATTAQTGDELETLLAMESEPERRIRLLLKTVAQADRMGQEALAGRHLHEAQTLVTQIPDEKKRGRLEANLAKAAARMQDRTTQTAPTPSTTPKNSPSVSPAKNKENVGLPPAPNKRAILALHNGYTGKAGPPHIRAVARAAPLCAAFGLDLMLIGFPHRDANDLVDQVETESRVGEGAGYARALLAAGRIQWVDASEHTQPTKWAAGRSVVATTPHPDPEKQNDLENLGPDAILIMGLGPEGLPRRLLQESDHHLELTGHGVSLETATAMGVLAQRFQQARRGRETTQ